MLKELIGDMAIKDLTPKSTNIGNRIVKNMRICGSGIYTYARREAELLHLAPVPAEYDKLEYINVYRPPEVLEKYKDYFARVPIITGRHVRVDTTNAKQLTVGMVGDTVESEVDKDDGETYLYTTGTIVAGDGIEAYEQYGQLSVGYDPIMKWKKGVHNGVEYQAELVGFNDVNHLLICKVARGGPQCMVMDSLDELSPLERFINKNQNGGKSMGIFAKIFGSVKPVAGDAQVVPVLLDSIACGADPATQVQKIRDIIGDSKDETFNGYLDELAQAKDEKPEVVAKAVGIVNDYYKTHLAGDEKEVIVKKDGDDKNVEVKKDGKETKDVEVKKDGDKKEVKVKEEVGGDKPAAGDSIDYDLLATKVAEKLKPAKAEQQTAGDEVPSEHLEELSMIIAGDSKSTDKVDSDGLFKDIWG